MHTIRVFYEYDPTSRLILVLPEDYIESWKQLCIQYHFELPHEVRAGGKNRFESVKAGIADLPEDCLIAVHDGVRPFVAKTTIERCFSEALKFGNAVPCTEVSESMRKVEKDGNRRVDRQKYRLIQTPQVFKGSVLKKAYKQEYHEQYTDDATVVEKTGFPIRLVEGNADNIKITRPHDLILAEAIKKNQDKNNRS